MAIGVNATLNLAVNAQSVAPAISAIQKEFGKQKIGLQVDLQIPKGIDREIYKVSNAFRTLDDRMRSLKFSSQEALGGIQAFIREISGGVNGMYKNLVPAAKSLDQTAKAITSVAKTSKQAKEETSSLAEAVGVSAKRFASFAIAAGAIANVVLQFKKGSDAALQFDRELVRLKQVGGDSRIAIEGIADRVTYLSKTLGVSSSELIKNATTLRQAGLSANDTKLALDSLAKTTLAPTFDSIGNTTEGVIAILSQFGQGVGSLEAQLGSINRVAADFAVESGDLVEAVKRTGGAFVSAGGNLEELLALFTSVRATTRESAESIATSFRTIFARLQRPETIKNLRDIGIELQDLEGRFVGPYEAVKRLNAGLANLPTSAGQFAKIVEEIGGVRQISKVIPLIQQFPTAIKAYNSAIEGQSSLSRDAAIAQEAFIVKINKLKESFLELFRVVVSNDLFRALLDSAIALTKGITDLVAAFKPLVPLLVGFSAIKIGSAIVGARTAFSAGFNKRGFAAGGVVSKYAEGGTVGVFASAKLANKAIPFDDGGIVPITPNTGIRSGTDTVPALLTEGEYVINRNSAKSIGYDTLDQLNTYAKGGPVGFSASTKAINFADGGDVPITPNTGIRSGTDTVPSLLTEGEYVIKKSAAQAIGYDTLDQLNQYANGGKVANNINIKTFDNGGLASTVSKAKDVDVENTITKGGLVQNIKNSKKAAMLALTTRSGDVSKDVTIVVPKIKLGKDIQANIPKDVSAVKADFTVAGPSTRFKDDVLTNTFKNSIKQAISSIASRAFNTKVPNIDDSIYDKVIDRSGQGRMFEAVLQAIGQNKVESNNQTFDFPEGVKGELADIFPGASGKIGDAKLADNTKSQISIVSKMLRSPQFSLGNKSKTTYEEFHKKAEKLYEKKVLNNPLSLSGMDYNQSREKLKGLTGIEVVKFPNAKKVTGFANGGIVGGRAGIRVTGGGMMATGNRFAKGGFVGRGTGIKMSGGGMMPFGHSKGGRILGFADGGKVPGGFGEVEGGGYVRPKVVGTSFPTGFNLNKLISDIGIQLSNVVKQVNYKAEEYQVAGRNVTGHFNPKNQSVTAVSGQIPTVLHEVGHAVDFSGSSSPQLSEGENVNSLINSTLKAYINASGQGGLFENQRLIGHGSLANYKPEKYRREAFADLFAGHTIQTGIKSGSINEKDLPESTRGFLSNPNVQKLLDVFGKGLSQAINALPQVKSNTGYSIAASELAAGGGKPPKPPIVTSGFAENEPQPRKDKTTRLLEEGLSREKTAKTETIPTKAVQNVLQAEREEIIKNTGFSSQTGTKVNPFTNEAQLGHVGAKFLTNDEYIKAIEEDAKKITKAKTKAKKTIEDLGADLEIGVVKLEQVGAKVRARVKTEDGQVRVFESENTYKKPKLVQNRIDRLKERGFDAKALLSGRGGFNEIDTFNENQKSTGRFGKTKDFIKSNFGLITGGALFAAPAVQQNITGTAEKPGSFGQTGARVGAGFTGTIEGAALGASLGSFGGPIGSAIGGVVGALAGLVTSLNTFDSEVKKINDSKISEAFASLQIDAKTGKAKNSSAVNTINEGFAKVENADLIFSTDKLFKEKRKTLYKDDAEELRDRIDKKVIVAKERFQQFSPQLTDIVKQQIIANPKQKLEELENKGPKFKVPGSSSPLGALAILKSLEDTKSLDELKQFAIETNKSATLQAKLNDIINTTSASMKDLDTALDVLSNAFDLATEKYQKDTAKSNLFSETLGGKVSAGVSAPSLSLFGEFGKNLEEFAKPGGILDSSRVDISKAIGAGLGAQQKPEDLEKSADIASQVFKNTQSEKGVNNPFAADISQAIKLTLAKNFANTEKIPEGDTENLRSKLTEEVVGQFKNLQQVRSGVNKQLESGFQNLNQQLGSFAERRSSVLQKGVEFQNRAEEFTSQNRALQEETLGSPTRFTPNGPISSREILAQEEIQKSTRQRANQLASFGIAINPAEADRGPDILKARLESAQKDLSAATVQQETAKNTGDLKGFQDATRKITDLSFTISNLKKGMDLLANSTTVLEAKNKALSVASDKFRSDLEGRKSDAEILTFGTQEEKQRLFQKEQLTQAVTNNPQTLQFLNDEQKQLVRERLNENDIGRTFAQTDRFGRDRGFGVATSSQVKDFLIQGNLSALQNNPATRLLGQNVARAQAGVFDEQARLNNAGKNVQDVEIKDLSSQRKSIEENFAKYINNLTDTFNKNSEVFKDFASAANNLATVLATNPIPNEIIMKNDSNITVNLNGGNVGGTLTNEAKNAIREEIRLSLVKNGVITDKTPARN